VNPTDPTPTLHPALRLPRPKKRCKAAEPLAPAEMNVQTVTSSHRKPKMKRTGQPHQQIWVRPLNRDGATRLKLPSAATLDEMMCGFTQASLSPAHFSLLENYHQRLEHLHARALELFYRYRPSVLLTLKRALHSAVAVISLMAALRPHPAAKPWL
jgi:hypothetical protein